MKRILFYSHNLVNQFRRLRICDNLIVDYFDIEVQKILRSIGYIYKMNPIVFIPGKQCVDTENLIFYNLDYFSITLPESCDGNFIGVSYDCG